MPEILRIASHLLLLQIFFNKIIKMEKQGGNKGELIKQILKAYESHLLVFHRYDKSNRDILRIF